MYPSLCHHSPNCTELRFPTESLLELYGHDPHFRSNTIYPVDYSICSKLQCIIIRSLLLCIQCSDSRCFFFQGDHTLCRKKMVRKPPHCRAGCIVEPCNTSRQPKLQFWPKWVKVVMLLCGSNHTPHIARGWKTLQMHGFPIQTWEIFKRL